MRQYIPWNDDAFADQFYDGLKGAVKDDMARTGHPTTLLELQTLNTTSQSSSQAYPNGEDPISVLYVEPCPYTHTYPKPLRR